MIIARSAGRLGNQLFVFAAIEKIRKPKEQLLLFGFAELKALLPASKHYRFINLKRAKSPTWAAVEAFLHLLAWLRLVGVMTHYRRNRSLSRSTGLLDISLFSAGFCIDERLLDHQTILKLAEICQSPVVFDGEVSANKSDWCFIHARRGDFLFWPHPDRPAALPESWFVKNSRAIKTQKPDCMFLIFSDDEEFGIRLSKLIEDATFIKASDIETLGIMSQCSSGVLSAGTYSWWGARFASLKGEGPFIAPNYWIGWRDRDWGDHEEIRDSDFIQWESVDKFQ
jgi:hypothetical protein